MSDDPSGPLVPGVCFAAFTLWDFYFGSTAHGVRLFDFAALGLLAAYVLAKGALRGPQALGFRLPTSRWGLLIAFLGFFLVSGIIGLIQQPDAFLRPISGVWLGLGVFVVFYCARLSQSWLSRLVGALLVLHTLALVTQFAVYHATGFLINYQAITGVDEPHVFSSIFRPSGLFMEPGSYAATTVMLLLLRWREGPRLDLVSQIALLGMLLSISFFGFLAVIALLMFFYWRRPRLWMLSGLVTALATAVLAVARARPEVVFMLNRFHNLGSDKSVGARVGVLSQLGVFDFHLWFGGGLGADFHPFGISGAGFLVAAVGLIGLVVWLGILLGLCPPNRRRQTLFSLALALVAAPIWTMMFWWAWLGLLCNRTLDTRGA